MMPGRERKGVPRVLAGCTMGGAEKRHSGRTGSGLQGATLVAAAERRQWLGLHQGVCVRGGGQHAGRVQEAVRCTQV